MWTDLQYTRLLVLVYMMDKKQTWFISGLCLNWTITMIGLSSLTSFKMHKYFDTINLIQSFLETCHLTANLIACLKEITNLYIDHIKVHYQKEKME